MTWSFLDRDVTYDRLIIKIEQSERLVEQLS